MNPIFRPQLAHLLRHALMPLLWLAAGHSLAQTCPPAGQSRDQLQQLKAAKWQVEKAATRQTLALALLPCLAHSEPLLRDELAFEALQFWMRSNALDVATVQHIRSTLLARLAQPDEQGFAHPFAALVLAEVARVDRKQPFLSAAERSDLVQQACSFLTAVRDYRGFDARHGWRHAVAHGADWLLQLSLNPQLGRTEQQAMLTALASQITPAGHAYQYGEGERLMQPVLYLAQKGDINAAAWEAWLQGLLPAAKGPTTAATLAARHNLHGFLLPLYFALQEGADGPARQNLLPVVKKALRDLG